jgi:photosystem II stability/assembly factor-like uncharacterized protein
MNPHGSPKYPLFVIAAVFGTCLVLAAGQQLRTPLLDSWEQHVKMRETSEFGLNWIQLGPVMNSARAETVQCDPSRPGTMYAAFGAGNLWKTVNNGLTWKPVFNNQSALGIGALVLSPSNPNVLWLGTGVSLKKPRNFTHPGTGVFRSDDGGETWKNMGLPDSYHIGRIAVHPKNPDIAYVAVLGHFWTPNENRGLYRTLDGGKTWERVLYVNERTGATEVVLAPSDPNVLYAATWEIYPGIYGKESGIYRSSDGGKTWTRLRGGFPDGPKTGRIGLAVSWSNPDKAYALLDNLNKEKNPGAEVYRTVDGGKTWMRTHREELDIFANIGWYFTRCYVNPRNDEEVYTLGIRLARSADGGKTFSLIGGQVFHLFPSSAEPLHLDQCDLWINPLNPAHLAIGNDGGCYVSYDKGESWLHYNNLPTGEFYDISVDNENPYQVYGGAQDDASVVGPAKEWDPRFPDGWKYIWLDAWSGGDGCFTMPDPEDTNTVYFSSQNGGIMRKDMKADRSKNIRPRLPRGQTGTLTYNFVAPYLISAHNHLTLYHAGNFVFKSVNQGDAWTLISPDFSRPEGSERASTAVGALAESRMVPGLLYAGTDKGAFWVTQNDGKDWVEHSAGLPDKYIRSICPSRFRKERVYVAVTGINEDDLKNHLFVSEDYGSHWKSLTANLPDEVANVILEDPADENILYAGLYRGVYVSVDRGLSWSLLGKDLPSASVSDLVIQEREMELVASTYGRGIYKLGIRPIQAAFRNGVPGSNILFETPEARLPWINDTHRDRRAGTAEKVPITFYLTAPAEVDIRVENKDGKVAWSVSYAAQKGFNQVRWDLITAKAQSSQPYFFRYEVYAEAGNYQIHILGKGIDLKGPLSIVERVGLGPM